MSNVNEVRAGLPVGSPASTSGPPNAPRTLQLKDLLRGKDLDVQMSLLAPAQAAAEPSVVLQSGVEASESMLAALRKVLKAANLRSATVTSGVRSSQKQAEAMYANIVATGVAKQLALYGSPGDKVINVYSTEKAARKTPEQIKAAMVDKIIELGPAHVSKHCSDTHDTIDVSAGSIANAARFKAALTQAQADGDISKFIAPGGGEPAWHIEKPK